MSPCSTIKLPGGGVAFVKHGATRFPRCKWCNGARAATQLCDKVISKTLGGAEITCDEKVCVQCAQRVDGKDFCPKHQE